MIYDQLLQQRWLRIRRHITKPAVADEGGFGFLCINGDIYVAKKSVKFRLRSHLDWAYYTPKTLADAINTDTVEQYYEAMLKDVKSDPNEWKDKDFEHELKAIYAQRAGRASLLNELIDSAKENCQQCWKTPGNDMRQWALEWEQQKGNRGHGLGDLNEPCVELEPGQQCRHCDRQF